MRHDFFSNPLADQKKSAFYKDHIARWESEKIKRPGMIVFVRVDDLFFATFGDQAKQVSGIMPVSYLSFSAPWGAEQVVEIRETKLDQYSASLRDLGFPVHIARSPATRSR